MFAPEFVLLTQPTYAMKSAITELHVLLKKLDGKDLAMMTPDAISALRATITKEFTKATASLHTLLLGQHSDSPRWLWTAEEAQHFGGEWLATYTLVDTGQMERAIGQHEKIQMAAALFPSLRLTVDIFAAYHHPGGSGLQVDPRLSISLRVDGDSELALIEDWLQLSKAVFPAHGNGLSVEIRPTECCCDDVVDPADIHESFSYIASAAREAGKREYGDTGITEAVQFTLTFDNSVDALRMQEAFEYVGQMFANVMVALK